MSRRYTAKGSLISLCRERRAQGSKRTPLPKFQVPLRSSGPGQWGRFFVELQSAIDTVAARNTLVLTSDFNAQVGAEDTQQWHGCLGKFALKRDTLHTSGTAMRLLDFCVANDLVLRNTFFYHKDIHLATWTV